MSCVAPRRASHRTAPHRIASHSYSYSYTVSYIVSYRIASYRIVMFCNVFYCTYCMVLKSAHNIITINKMFNNYTNRNDGEMGCRSPHQESNLQHMCMVYCWLATIMSHPIVSSLDFFLLVKFIRMKQTMTMSQNTLRRRPPHCTRTAPRREDACTRGGSRTGDHPAIFVVVSEPVHTICLFRSMEIDIIETFAFAS